MARSSDRTREKPCSVLARSAPVWRTMRERSFSPLIFSVMARGQEPGVSKVAAILVARLSQLVDSGWAVDGRYAGKTSMITGIIVSLFLLCGFSPVHAWENGNQGKTWKTVDELSAEEKTALDLRS